MLTVMYIIACSPSSFPVRKHARTYLDVLQDLYNEAWRNHWPSELCTISQAALRLYTDEPMEVDDDITMVNDAPDRASDVLDLYPDNEVEPTDGGANLKSSNDSEWKYTCLLNVHPLM